MSIEDEKADNFIQDRLDALYEVDCKIVSLLDSMSTLFSTFSSPKQQDNREMKETFSGQTEKIYGILSKVAIDLRKEVKVMDDNIGVYDKNKDGVMILPIAVDQKNTTLGRDKLKKQLEELNVLLKGEKEEDIDMKAPDADTIKEAQEAQEDIVSEPVIVEVPGDSGDIPATELKEEGDDADDDLFEEIM